MKRRVYTRIKDQSCRVGWALVHYLDIGQTGIGKFISSNSGVRSIKRDRDGDRAGGQGTPKRQCVESKSEDGDVQLEGGVSPALGLDIGFLEIARRRWLTSEEVEAVLCAVDGGFREIVKEEPLFQPPSGTLVVYDKSALRHFRRDGHDWVKKRDGSTVREDNEKLKVRGIVTLSCGYSYSAGSSLKRRVYRRVCDNSCRIGWALVHYLDVGESMRPAELFKIPEESARVLLEGPQVNRRAAAVTGALPWRRTSLCSTVSATDEDTDDVYKELIEEPLPSGEVDDGKGSPCSFDASKLEIMEVSTWYTPPEGALADAVSVGSHGSADDPWSCIFGDDSIRF